MVDLAIHPLTWAWVLMIGAGLRALRARDRATAAAGLGAALLLTLAGGTPLPDWLLARLEAPYLGPPGRLPPAADAVVMLGGGHRASPFEMHGLDAGAAFDRALATLALGRRAGITNLILGGGKSLRSADSPSDGRALAGFLGPLLPPGTRILELPPSRTTRDECVALGALARRERWTRIVLVTSASHMPRAVELFRSTGLEVFPAACDFAGTAALEAGGNWTLAPRPSSLQTLLTALHEHVGSLWYRWRGWNRPAGP